MTERFLATGAQGCIGSWIIHELLSDDVEAVALDLSSDASRLQQLTPAADLAEAEFVVGEIIDAATVDPVFAEKGIIRVIHLAALHVPFRRRIVAPQ